MFVYFTHRIQEQQPGTISCYAYASKFFLVLVGHVIITVNQIWHLSLIRILKKHLNTSLETLTRRLTITTNPVEAICREPDTYIHNCQHKFTLHYIRLHLKASSTPDRYSHFCFQEQDNPPTDCRTVKLCTDSYKDGDITYYQDLGDISCSTLII